MATWFVRRTRPSTGTQEGSKRTEGSMEALRPAEAAAQRSLADAGLHLKPGWIYEVPLPPPPCWSGAAASCVRATREDARPVGGTRARKKPRARRR